MIAQAMREVSKSRVGKKENKFRDMENNVDPRVLGTYIIKLCTEKAEQYIR